MIKQQTYALKNVLRLQETMNDHLSVQNNAAHALMHFIAFLAKLASTYQSIIPVAVPVRQGHILMTSTLAGLVLKNALPALL